MTYKSDWFKKVNGGFEKKIKILERISLRKLERNYKQIGVCKVIMQGKLFQSPKLKTGYRYENQF